MGKGMKVEAILKITSIMTLPETEDLFRLDLTDGETSNESN